MARGRKKSIGLGDTIEKITEATGIKKVVEVFAEATGIDCGCEERKAKLNQLFSYHRKVNCLNQDDYKTLSTYFTPAKNQLTPLEQREITSIYKRVFDKNVEPSNCSSCWRDILGQLRKVYNEYEVNE